MQYQLRLLAVLASLLASQAAAQSAAGFFGGQQQQPYPRDTQADRDDQRLQLGYEQWRRRCAKFMEQDSAVTTRITGGDVAQPGLLPYQVGLLLLLQNGMRLQCGGSLISAQHVLTAAHCVNGALGGSVYLGATRYADAQDAAAVYNVTRRHFSVYPGYLGFGGYNDLALIRLPQQAPLSQRVQTIALAQGFMNQQLLEQQSVRTSGWGRLSDAVTAVRPAERQLLHYVDVRVMQQQRCVCYFLPGLVSQRRHICTDGAGLRGSCEGDSGGPLVYRWRELNYLVGVTSFGSAAGCEIGAPTVFTRVTEYLPWIQQQLQTVGAGGAGGYYDY